jgi:YbgC/YbaW family acyl-CoA thioester hydrolase
MRFEKKNLRVLPQDSDSFAIINWETYVRYCEEGELGFMEMMGFSFTYFYEKQKVFFPRRAACFEYLSQVKLGDYIDIETGVKKIGQTSFTMEHHFYKKERENGERTLAAKAEITAVAFDERTHSKTELPDELVAALKKCMQP